MKHDSPTITDRHNPDVISAGRGEPVDHPGLVGPQNRTEQSVFLGLDADQVGHVPASPVDPDVMMYRNQSVTDSPVGQDKTRRPVGTEGMLAVNDSDRLTAGGPVGRLFKLDLLDPSRMSSLDELNQPLAVGPVGQPFITGRLGNHVRESDCKLTNQINSGPEGSTGILDPVNQTGRHIQTDRMKIGTVNGQASLGDTPPSSDSGVHSLGEQWENMSTNSIDMKSEQNERPSYGDTTRRCVSDNNIPPNTEERDTIDYPWTYCLLERKSDDISSVVIQRNDREVQFNKVTIYGSEHSMVHSGTDGRNSDIGALSDFSDDDEETGVEQLSACRIPGCYCEGRIPFMEWGSEDMTETDDSDYEGSVEWTYRLYAENYNYDLPEGMTPRTCDPPPPTEVPAPEVRGSDEKRGGCK